MKHSQTKRGPRTAASAYAIIIEPAEGADGTWTAEVPAFGLVTQGLGPNGARKAALDAIEGYVDAATRTGEPIPPGDIITTRPVAWSASPSVRRERPRR
jgi:predicted RNase H-like HicB family nuclease